MTFDEPNSAYVNRKIKAAVPVSDPTEITYRSMEGPDMETNDREWLTTRLLRQAQGSATAEAAVVLLSEALNGRLLDAVSLAWNDDEQAMAAIDWPATRDKTGYLSGGERRILALADSLGSGHPVDLSDALTGLDVANALVALDAFACALQVPDFTIGR